MGVCEMDLAYMNSRSEKYLSRGYRITLDFGSSPLQAEADQTPPETLDDSDLSDESDGFEKVVPNVPSAT